MPGVPLDAFDRLKKAFKGVLKPKSKKQSSKKQGEQDAAASAGQQDGPPKLPPHHPLATGQISEPFMVVPGSEGSAVPGTASEGAVVKEQAQKQDEDKAQVSPTESAMAAKVDAARDDAAEDDAVKSEPVSAVTAEHDKSLSPPKTDGAAHEVKATAPIASQPFTQNAKPVAAENVKPIATEPATAATANADVQPATKPITEPARIIDEKMTVMAEEPPEIKTKAAAPGMSATSGPLDDFPMEGDKP